MEDSVYDWHGVQSVQMDYVRYTTMERKSLRAPKHCKHSAVGSVEGCTCGVSACITALSVKKEGPGNIILCAPP